ncbi:hypothetical protein MSKU15_1437 [Komagataeibacter diospyri]|nr:hypothetical protein MSKU15_1437 [Komagataeibacter diospyri]
MIRYHAGWIDRGWLITSPSNTTALPAFSRKEKFLNQPIIWAHVCRDGIVIRLMKQWGLVQQQKGDKRWTN